MVNLLGMTWILQLSNSVLSLNDRWQTTYSRTNPTSLMHFQTLMNIDKENNQPKYEVLPFSSSLFLSFHKISWINPSSATTRMKNSAQHALPCILICLKQLILTFYTWFSCRNLLWSLSECESLPGPFRSIGLPDFLLRGFDLGD